MYSSALPRALSVSRFEKIAFRLCGSTPTVGVDPQSRNAIFDNLETLKARGKALLYTTHYMEEVERLADRVVIIDHGRVVASDTLDGLQRYAPPGSSGHVSLEQIFLALTGRTLRD